MNNFALFTDVSLAPKLKLGFGAYLLVPASFLEISVDKIEKAEIVERLVTRKFTDTSSTKLEVETMLWALAGCQKRLAGSDLGKLYIYSDSQCVVGLLRRRSKMERNGFLAKRSNTLLKNASLYREFYRYYDELGFEIIKVTGHTSFHSQDTIHRIYSFVDREVRKVLRVWLQNNSQK